ncbi:MAG: N-acetylmuramoyl-L-alanine amidase [Pseudomonadota bacterium]
MRAVITGFLCWVLAVGCATAQELSALARVDAARTFADDRRVVTEFQLGLSLPVPFRVYTLATPKQLVIELSEVAWAGLPVEALTTDRLSAVQAGTLAPGWSGMIVTLSEPVEIETAEMQTTDGAAALVLRLRRTSEEAFLASAGLPDTAAAQPVAAAVPPRDDRAPVVVLDPGHGGVDPGAERDGVNEADLMLLMARELRGALRRLGVEVHMTRDADVFVGLPARASLARQVEADAFISLHADALEEGYAEGATAHTLPDDAAKRASALLAERVGREDILSGVDLSGQDDQIATVLLDLARQDTGPRSERLKLAIIDGLSDAGARINNRPSREAHFAVLRSADVPSVLVEVGFLSSKRDRIELQSPEKRGRIINGLANGILGWLQVDETERALNRQ